MLVELRIQNLLLIETAELRPQPGLNVITGETGAGKTMLAHALDLLLGGKPRTGIVRPGASEAYVEGVFEASPQLQEAPELADLRQRVDLDSGELVLARRVGADGRSRAFVQGRAASAADLRELGGRLVAFFGQHEHRRLTVGSAQLDLLDAYCGQKQLELRRSLATAHRRGRELERELSELSERVGSRDRDLDLLAFELDEIEKLAPSEEEERELTAERERLRSLDSLLAAAAAGVEAIAPEGDDPGAAALLARAERFVQDAGGADPQLAGLGPRLSELRIEAEELARELRGYAAGLESEPGRLEQVEERLEQYDRLKRKHGGSVQAVLAHAEHCRRRRQELERAEVESGRAEAELGAARQELRRLGEEISAARRQAAPRLAEQVQEELGVLAMSGASFGVELEPRTEIGLSGSEHAELMLAVNPGVPAAPLREAASGGELSRVMLALMTIVGATSTPTLAFDEVDAGVGGQTARAVGERLRRLAVGRQVLCITHLPQVAALGESHFRVEKQAAGQVAVASVEALDGDEIVEELCRMLGAEASDSGARRHAQELLAAA